MKELIDVTHTVKASAAPSEGARYVLDTETNERYWIAQGIVLTGVPEPEQNTYRGILEAPVPDVTVPPVAMPTIDPVVRDEPEVEVVDTLESRTKHQTAKHKK